MPSSSVNDLDLVTAATTTPLTDAQIAGVTQAANSSEVEQSRIAQAKAKNSDVKDFADMMVLHHQAAQDEQASIGIETAHSTLSDKLAAQADAALTQLKRAAGDFDRVYIDSQVEAHRGLLSIINSQLLPNVKDAKLKAYIDNIKVKVAMHLEKAESEQLKLSALAHETSPRLH